MDGVAWRSEHSVAPSPACRDGRTWPSTSLRCLHFPGAYGARWRVAVMVRRWGPRRGIRARSGNHRGRVPPFVPRVKGHCHATSSSSRGDFGRHLRGRTGIGHFACVRRARSRGDCCDAHTPPSRHDGLDVDVHADMHGLLAKREDLGVRQPLVPVQGHAARHRRVHSDDHSQRQLQRLRQPLRRRLHIATRLGEGLRQLPGALEDRSGPVEPSATRGGHSSPRDNAQAAVPRHSDRRRESRVQLHLQAHHRKDVRDRHDRIHLLLSGTGDCRR